MKRFLWVWCLVLLVSYLSLHSYFYEDSIYINYAISAIQDLDYNLVNQLHHDFSKIVTSQYSPPTHHSVVQTPLLIITNFLSSLVSTFIPVKSIPFNLFSGVLVSFVCLISAYFFLRKAADNLGVKINKFHYGVFFITSSLGYFSFFVLTVMEIFTFMLSSYVLYSLALMLQKKFKGRGAFALGSAIGMLFITKITFLPLFILTIYFAVKAFDTIRAKAYFVFGIIIVIASAVLKDYATFGQIVLFSHAMNEYTTEYSWLNLMLTFKIGFFGVGGLFYSSPMFLIGFVGFIHFFKNNIGLSRERSLFVWMLLCWLGMSFFQTTFISGPMLEDHFVGRLTLMSLPLLIIGVAHLDKISDFKNHQAVKFAIVIGCALLHIYALINYMAISSEGHYEYALRKNVNSLSELIEFFYIYNNILIDHFLIDGWHLFAFSFVVAFIIYYMLKFRSKLYDGFYLYLIPATFVILSLSALDIFNSKKNGYDFVVSNNLIEEITVAEHPSVYSFNYIVDILRSQLYSTENHEMREIIIKKHKNYLRSLAPHIDNASSSFKDAIKKEDIEYGYYQKFSK